MVILIHMGHRIISLSRERHTSYDLLFLEEGYKAFIIAEIQSREVFWVSPKFEYNPSLVMNVKFTITILALLLCTSHRDPPGKFILIQLHALYNFPLYLFLNKQIW